MTDENAPKQAAAKGLGGKEHSSRRRSKGGKGPSGQCRRGHPALPAALQGQEFCNGQALLLLLANPPSKWPPCFATAPEPVLTPAFWVPPPPLSSVVHQL